ncbi:unnamed protein product [Effrenium voratum]|uniref:Malonyl-CoA:ACP transacylase (MAT) domain-containing protein n=1 Tax=Effrenium voratum TaxID=2562239 RepID=A0AA36IBW6_9DINO|nr:unnamed protein product [Effrenium voratum]CAJ1440412.1 unnamed protein product [Effrenium voratum]
MAAWDPFSDPADEGVPVTLKGGDIIKVDDGDAPLDPWDDGTFVALAREAAAEAAARQAAALEAWEAQQKLQADENRKQEERRERLRQEARDFAKLSIEERREKLQERQRYAEMAMEHIANAPAVAAERLRKSSSKLPEVDELALGSAAASIAAVDMGIKISFKSKAEASRIVALLFPDQSSRSLKMLKGLQELPGARRLREQSRALLGWDPLEGPQLLNVYELLRGPEGWLEHTQFCQPAMYVVQVAAVEKLRDKRPGALERCRAVAGLSLGDYAALTLAEVWDFEMGLRAVQLRGELMEAAIAEQPQAALAVAGLSEEHLGRLCEDCRESEVCGVAQRLFPEGFLCAGHDTAVARLLERARRAEGCKQVQMLKLAGACHTQLMEAASEQLLELLQSFEGSMKPPRLDLYLSCGKKVAAGSSPSCLPRLLAQQLMNQANWMGSVSSMLKDGCGEFYECGPLNQLKGAMKRIDPVAHKATIALDVYSQDAQMKPGSLPPRWADLPMAMSAEPGAPH